MLRWRGLDSTPSGWGRCVVTIGVFDGVHRGHQQIIGQAVQRARDTGLPAVVLTFDPHPTEVVRPGSHPAVLTALRRKAELIAQLGVDVLCVMPFTTEFCRLTRPSSCTRCWSSTCTRPPWWWGRTSASVTRRPAT